MPTDVIMPQMGESIFEGTITKWLKQPGEKVQRDEPLFEISTDKVDAEIPAPASGTLQDIKVQAGATVQVNTVVGTIAGEGEAAGAAPSAPPPAQPATAGDAGKAATFGFAHGYSRHQPVHGRSRWNAAAAAFHRSRTIGARRLDARFRRLGSGRRPRARRVRR